MEKGKSYFEIKENERSEKIKLRHTEQETKTLKNIGRETRKELSRNRQTRGI